MISGGPFCTRVLLLHTPILDPLLWFREYVISSLVYVETDLNIESLIIALGGEWQIIWYSQYC